MFLWYALLRRLRTAHRVFQCDSDAIWTFDDRKVQKHNVSSVKEWIPGLCHSNETLTLPSRFIVSRKFCTSPQERYAQWIKGEKSHLGVFSEQEMK